MTGNNTTFDWTKPIQQRNGEQAKYLGVLPEANVAIIAMKNHLGSWCIATRQMNGYCWIDTTRQSDTDIIQTPLPDVVGDVDVKRALQFADDRKDSTIPKDIALNVLASAYRHLLKRVEPFHSFIKGIRDSVIHNGAGDWPICDNCGLAISPELIGSACPARGKMEVLGDAEVEAFWETVQFALIGESNFQHNRNRLPKHHPDGVPREFGTEKEKEIAKAQEMLPRVRSLLLTREEELAKMRELAQSIRDDYNAKLERNPGIFPVETASSFENLLHFMLGTKDEEDHGELKIWLEERIVITTNDRAGT